LRYYSGPWWKIEDLPLWYLAGRHYNLKSGMWYYSDETGDYNGPYLTRTEAAEAQEKYANSNS
jgi:hypothetical protein